MFRKAQNSNYISFQISTTDHIDYYGKYSTVSRTNGLCFLKTEAQQSVEKMFNIKFKPKFRRQRDESKLTSSQFCYY